MEAINHIYIENGKAYVAGRGYLKAEMVARLHFDEHASIERVMEQYNLSAGEVHACLAYYYDHRELLDAELQVKLDEISANAIQSHEHLAKIQAQHTQNSSE